MKELQRANRAHDLYKGLLQVLEMKRLAGVALGEKLFKLKADNEYRNAIGDCDSWDEFLRSPEIQIDPREANRAMQIFDEFCIKRGFSTEELTRVGVRSLNYLLPIAKSGQVDEEHLRELVVAGSELSVKAFKERLHDAKAGGTGTRTFEFVLMRRIRETGNLQKVHGFSSEEIFQVFSKAGINLSEQLMPEII